MSIEELEAARDYWSQIFERLSADPMATLVERNAILAELQTGLHKKILDAYGLSAEDAEAVNRDYISLVSGAPVTSPGVDPHAEHIFARLCKRVEEACDKLPELGARNVIRGIEPKLGVFASRLPVMMTDASIVTVGSQVFRFCGTLSKAVAMTIAIDPSGWDNVHDLEPMQASLRARPDVLSYWFQIIASFTMTGTSVLVPFKVPPLTDSFVRGEALEAIEIFAVSHEYAHHIMKHGRLQAASVESGKDGRARREEFEADAIAIAISQMVTGHTKKENWLMLAGVGMVVLLHALDMLGEARRLLGIDRGPVTAQGSHPSTAERVSFVDGQAWLWPKHDSAFRHFRRAYGNMMRLAWEEIRPIFVEMASGRRDSGR